jgi:nitroimidazol reductase NimA-like FMN-containing flavoprotein (pyridoxamine 5'-phosphate oxidase superfamily)
MSLIMTKQEREAFLADVHVGIISISEEGRGPLTVPIWYAYDPGGDLRIMTGRESRKGRLLARARRFSLCVQAENPPYKYVSVEGAIVSTKAADIERDLRPLASRYLGEKMGKPLCGGDAKLTYACRQRAYPHASGTMVDHRLLQGR